MNFLDRIERIPLRIAMARIEASKFVGEDGKEYFRFPAPSTNYPVRKMLYPNGCPIITEGPQRDDL